MDILHAKDLLSALADGINPLTGEVLSEEDSCNQIEIVRALHTVLDAIPKSKLSQSPENAGKPWTKEEETALVEAFDEGESVARIAKVHGRSRGAIEARLVALGKMTNSFVFKRR